MSWFETEEARQSWKDGAKKSRKRKKTIYENCCKRLDELNIPWEKVSKGVLKVKEKLLYHTEENHLYIGNMWEPYRFANRNNIIKFIEKF